MRPGLNRRKIRKDSSEHAVRSLATSPVESDRAKSGVAAAIAPVLLGFALTLSIAESSQAENLMQFYEHALQGNPALKIKEFGVSQAEAQRDQVRSRLLPQVSATGSYSWNDYDDSASSGVHYTGTRGMLQARQSLLDLGTRHRLAGATEIVMQAEWQREDARSAVAGEVIDRYLTVLQAEDELGQLRSEKETTATQLSRLRFMQQRQLAKVTDLYEVEAYFYELQTREIEAVNARLIALERLRETTGLAAQNVSGLARLDLPAVDHPQEFWLKEALEQNLALKAQSKAVQAGLKLVDSSRAEHFPKLDLTASGTYSDQGYDNRSVPSYTVGSIGALLTVPIYEGGRVGGVEREAIARLEIARQQLEQARRDVVRRVSSAYLSAQASFARIASKDKEVNAMTKVVDAQEKGYKLGSSTIEDVLRSRQNLLKARVEQSKARYDYIRDMAVLDILAGKMSDQKIEEINRWMEAEKVSGSADEASFSKP